MRGKSNWDKERALELRRQGMGYSEIARAIGAPQGTVAWWFKHAKSGPHETPKKAGRPSNPKPEAPEPMPEPKAAEWDNDKRIALVECAKQAVERTGMSLGECMVELGRMLRERRKPS